IVFASTIIALLLAIDSIFIVVFSAKVFLVANMSVYSTFMMLGGMALPFVFGFCIGEEFTLGKAIGFVLIAVASLFSTDFKSKSSRAAIKYYIGVFVCNGMSGVLSTINMRLPVHSQSGAFVLITNAWKLVICLAVIAIIVAKTKRKLLVAPKSAFAFASIHAVISTIGSLLIMISLEVLDASVQYPLITGGTMVFSTLLCFVRREKLTARDIIAVLIATASSVVVVF
ncbi:MAG: hypothetical protein IKU61_04665, partial [Clostridia bacterium]|nr:hypothetical protein [Clostridia bacterium]